MRKSLLFVCLGNICRSPAAHGVMEELVRRRGLTKAFDIDSAGMGGWHVGQLPDRRMRQYGGERGYRFTHRARQFEGSGEFDRFDLILVMDKENYRDVLAFARTEADRRKVKFLADYLQHHPHYHDIPDPYYGGAREFNLALDLVEDACEGLLNELVRGADGAHSSGADGAGRVTKEDV